MNQLHFCTGPIFSKTRHVTNKCPTGNMTKPTLNPLRLFLEEKPPTLPCLGCRREAADGQLITRRCFWYRGSTNPNQRKKSEITEEQRKKKPGKGGKPTLTAAENRR